MSLTPDSVDDGRSVVHFKPPEERQAALDTQAWRTALIEFWEAGAKGVIVASLAYPPLALAYSYAFISFANSGSMQFPGVSGLLYVTPFLLLACLAAVLIMGPLSFWISLLAFRVCESLRLATNSLELSTFVGGLCGLVASSFVVVFALLYGGILFGLGLSLLATVLCQLGAAFGSQRLLKRAYLRELCSDRSRFPRFRIMHFVWLTVVLALFLSTLKLFGASAEFIYTVAALGVVWLVCQAFTLKVAVGLARWAVRARYSSSGTSS